MANLPADIISRFIDDLADKPVAFHRVFAKICGGATQGLFLAQLWYWSRVTKDPDGWFWKTSKEWESETALTRREQENARRSLKNLGILEEKLMDLPAKLYYRMNKSSVLIAYQKMVDRETSLADVTNLDVICDKHDCHIRQTYYTETTSETTSDIINSSASASQTTNPNGNLFDGAIATGASIDQAAAKPTTTNGLQFIRKNHVTNWRKEIEDEFVELYPRGGPAEKRRSIERVKLKNEDAELIRSVLYALHAKYNSETLNRMVGKLPMAATWCNQRRWEFEDPFPSLTSFVDGALDQQRQPQPQPSLLDQKPKQYVEKWEEFVITASVVDSPGFTGGSNWVGPWSEISRNGKEVIIRVKTRDIDNVSR
jgi:hypothetical protein